MRDDGVLARRRWLRPAEYWECETELFSGETVLHDCVALEDGDRVAARLILIRFLAAQYLVNLLRGDWPQPLLRMERSETLNVIGTGALLDRELRALRRAVELLDARLLERGVAQLIAAAELAAERGHGSGALALLRIGYEASLARGWHAQGARAARGIERLARAGGGERSRKRWTRRAAVLERRAAAA
ncbi:MAG TPA: hypothetical protein VK939_12555 [Longimicrobiales bacterium]|nr:hypothetical protein [Longimicrobiales bacterium]